MSTDRATAIRPQLKSPKPIFWERSAGATDYPSAVARMEADAAAIADGTGHERVWLVEHPPIYTAGTSARSEDLVIADRFPVYCTGRGGQFTYHGPGQRVAYVMLDLKQRGSDVRSFVAALEAWLIGTLASFGVVGERRTDRIGVWVRDPRLRTQEAKIAAIGIRVRRWVSFHGVSLNVDPDLSHFAGIVPCGVHEYGVTSLAQLGIRASLDEVDSALHTSFDAIFGPTLAG